MLSKIYKGGNYIQSAKTLLSEKNRNILTVIISSLTKIVCERSAMVFSNSTIVNMVAGDLVISEAFLAAALLTLCANFKRSVTNKFYKPIKCM